VNPTDTLRERQSPTEGNLLAALAHQIENLVGVLNPYSLRS